MTSEAFLDSVYFNLELDQNAHGGFSVEGGGQLAMGLARESISAVMPLYFFDEHWEIAKRKGAPLFGHMCTLDILGYH